jgi:hypothetical protein
LIKVVSRLNSGFYAEGSILTPDARMPCMSGVGRGGLKRLATPSTEASRARWWEPVRCRLGLLSSPPLTTFQAELATMVCGRFAFAPVDKHLTAVVAVCADVASQIEGGLVELNFFRDIGDG